MTREIDSWAFFSGPSKYVTLRMAQGVASIALQLKHVRGLNLETQNVILKGMKSEGAPTSLDELIESAASVITQYKMGAWKKAQFLGMIKGSMISQGMSKADAAYITGLIELDDGISRPKAHNEAVRNTPRDSANFSPAAVVAPTKPAVEPVAKSVQRFGFKAGETIVYPAHGVGQILTIEEQEIAGAKLELFVINFAQDKMTLRVPTTKFADVGMRKLSDSSTIQRALEVLSRCRPARRDDRLRFVQECEAKINSSDIVALAEVARDLHMPNGKLEQSSHEYLLLRAAIDRLSREVAAVNQVSTIEAVNEIEGLLMLATQ